MSLYSETLYEIIEKRAGYNAKRAVVDLLVSRNNLQKTATEIIDMINRIDDDLEKIAIKVKIPVSEIQDAYRRYSKLYRSNEALANLNAEKEIAGRRLRETNRIADLLKKKFKENTKKYKRLKQDYSSVAENRDQWESLAKKLQDDIRQMLRSNAESEARMREEFNKTISEAQKRLKRESERADSAASRARKNKSYAYLGAGGTLIGLGGTMHYRRKFKNEREKKNRRRFF